MIYIGTNPDTNSKAISFGAQKLNVGGLAKLSELAKACAYHTKCCQDEFSLCYATDKARLIE